MYCTGLCQPLVKLVMRIGKSLNNKRNVIATRKHSPISLEQKVSPFARKTGGNMEEAKRLSSKLITIFGFDALPVVDTTT